MILDAKLLALAFGALVLTQPKKANAATAATAAKSTTSRAPVVTASIQPPTVPAYLYTPSAAAQYASYAQGRPTAAAQQSPITAGFNFLSELVKGRTLAGGYATDYNPQNLGMGQSAEQDANIGESQARAYYVSHADEFMPDPVDYAQVNATPWAQAALNDPTEY